MNLDPILAITLSLKVAVLSTLLGLPLAVFCAWILSHKKFKGKVILSSLLFIPLVLPPVVTGIILLNTFGRNTPLGSILTEMNLPLSFSFFGAVIAAMIVGLPLFVMLIRNSFEAVDREYEDMAMTLGHSPWKTFLKFTLPMALPGILAGAVVAFARALGEFGATVILAGNMEGETRTLSLAIYTLLDIPNGESEIQKLCLVSLFLSLLSLLFFEALNKWHRKRLGLGHVN